MYIPHPQYPTPQHAAAAQAVCELFSHDPAVDSVLLMGSTARGKASPDSCLDMLVLVRPEVLEGERNRLEALWQVHYPSDPVFQDVIRVGAFSQVELEFIDGRYDPAGFSHGWTSGADEFELAVGNHLAYSAALWEGGNYYQELRDRWLPYYGETLRAERLAMTLKYCRNNLAHIPLYAPRGLDFQCFKRLYHAFEEFLQALFISRRVYPIAYDKWVREEVVEILGLPEVYQRLPRLLEVQPFEGQRVAENARALEALMQELGL